MNQEVLALPMVAAHLPLMNLHAQTKNSWATFLFTTVGLVGMALAIKRQKGVADLVRHFSEGELLSLVLEIKRGTNGDSLTVWSKVHPFLERYPKPERKNLKEEIKRQAVVELALRSEGTALYEVFHPTEKGQPQPEEIFNYWVRTLMDKLRLWGSSERARERLVEALAAISAAWLDQEREPRYAMLRVIWPDHQLEPPQWVTDEFFPVLSNKFGNKDDVVRFLIGRSELIGRSKSLQESIEPLFIEIGKEHSKIILTRLIKSRSQATSEATVRWLEHVVLRLSQESGRAHDVIQYFLGNIRRIDYQINHGELNPNAPYLPPQNTGMEGDAFSAYALTHLGMINWLEDMIRKIAKLNEQQNTEVKTILRKHIRESSEFLLLQKVLGMTTKQKTQHSSVRFRERRMGLRDDEEGSDSESPNTSPSALSTAA